MPIDANLEPPLELLKRHRGCGHRRRYFMANAGSCVGLCDALAGRLQVPGEQFV